VPLKMEDGAAEPASGVEDTRLPQRTDRREDALMDDVGRRDVGPFGCQQPMDGERVVRATAAEPARDPIEPPEPVVIAREDVGQRVMPYMT
jgi:hypothetical protein